MSMLYKMNIGIIILVFALLYLFPFYIFWIENKICAKNPFTQFFCFIGFVFLYMIVATFLSVPFYVPAITHIFGENSYFLPILLAFALFCVYFLITIFKKLSISFNDFLIAFLIASFCVSMFKCPFYNGCLINDISFLMGNISFLLFFINLVVQIIKFARFLKRRKNRFDIL